MLREKLASNAHERWSRWTEHLLRQCTLHEDGRMTIPAAFVNRWKRQMATAFSDLTTQEKASDFTEADIIISIIEETSCT